MLNSEQTPLILATLTERESTVIAGQAAGGSGGEDVLMAGVGVSQDVPIVAAGLSEENIILLRELREKIIFVVSLGGGVLHY